MMELVKLVRRNLLSTTLKYGRALSIIFLLATMLVGCDLFSTNLDACEYAYIPTIAEFGPGFVILGGNGTRLEINDSYSFHGGMESGFYVIQLLEANREGAKLEYKIETESPGEADSVDAHTDRYECVQSIAADDVVSQSHPKTYMLQVDDFKRDWRIEGYTEVVNPAKIDVYQSELTRQDGIFLEAIPAESKGDKNFPYELYIETNYFDTEADAASAYSKIVWGDNSFASPDFHSQFADYAEYCREGSTHFCRYLGQHDRYMVEVVMSFPFKFDKSDLAAKQTVNPSDWQYVVDLVEAKLLENDLK